MTVRVPHRGVLIMRSNILPPTQIKQGFFPMEKTEAQDGTGKEIHATKKEAAYAPKNREHAASQNPLTHAHKTVPIKIF